MAVLINLAVALFYPFGDDGDEGMAMVFDVYIFFIIMAILFPHWKMRTESQNPVLAKCIV